MKICPNCMTGNLQTDEQSCMACGWQCRKVDGVTDFLSDRDRESSVFGVYSDNYDVIANDDLSSSILDETYIQHQANNMLRYMGDISGANVCDLGSGKGTLVRAMRAAGAGSVMAVDISLPYLRRFTGDENITPVLANAENLPFDSEFDVITSTDVMEHVLNIGSYLISMRRALRPGGRAYIRVPYRESLLQYSRFEGCAYDYVHLRSFNRRLLKDIFRDAGFKVRRTHLDGFVIYTPRPIYMKSKWTGAFYNSFQAFCLSKLSHHSDVNQWNSVFARLFMRPQEIVVFVERAA